MSLLVDKMPLALKLQATSKDCTHTRKQLLVGHAAHANDTRGLSCSRTTGSVLRSSA